MNAAHIGALLFALAVVFVFGAGIGAVVRHTDREIDRATRLPDPRRPRDDEPPTERIDPALIPHDLPRRGSLIDRNL